MDELPDYVNRVKAAQTSADLNNAGVFEYLGRWLKSHDLQTDAARDGVRKLVAGLLSPRFYPEGYDFFAKSKDFNILSILKDERLSSIYHFAEVAYNNEENKYTEDQQHRAYIELLRGIKNVDEKLLSADELEESDTSITRPMALDEEKGEEKEKDEEMPTEAPQPPAPAPPAQFKGTIETLGTLRQIALDKLKTLGSRK